MYHQTDWAQDDWTNNNGTGVVATMAWADQWHPDGNPAQRARYSAAPFRGIWRPNSGHQVKYLWCWTFSVFQGFLHNTRYKNDDHSFALASIWPSGNTWCCTHWECSAYFAPIPFGWTQTEKYWQVILKKEQVVIWCCTSKVLISSFKSFGESD